MTRTVKLAPVPKAVADGTARRNCGDARRIETPTRALLSETGFRIREVAAVRAALLQISQEIELLQAQQQEKIETLRAQRDHLLVWLLRVEGADRVNCSDGRCSTHRP